MKDGFFFSSGFLEKGFNPFYQFQKKGLIP
jgi:hypothetical protein